MTREYRRFTKEFKLNALQQMDNSDKSMAQLARELDIRVNMLYKWRKELNKNKQTAFKRTESTDTSKLDTVESLKKEVAELKKTAERLRAEKDILKKATAYFANECQ